MSVFDRIARLCGRATAAGKLAGRTLLPFDTNPVPANWEHITKVDPEDAKKLPLVYPRYLTHTDAISVGGSADVTERNTIETFRLLESVATPAFHEPSAPSHVTEETLTAATFLAIPQVLNGDDESFVGSLGTGTEFIREELAPKAIDDIFPGWLPNRFRDRLAEFMTGWMLSAAVFEAYIIQNPDSAAAREAGVDESDLLPPKKARQRAMAAERYFGSELLYLEYSGTYGGDEAVETLESMTTGLAWSRLWYGGGIDSREKATEILAAGADSIVVGDVFHRIAEEEASLAREFIDDEEMSHEPESKVPAQKTVEVEKNEKSTIDADRIYSWLDRQTAIEETAAVEYLSTIPSVSDPVERARENLVAGIAAHATLESAQAHVRRSLETEAIAGPEDLPAILDSMADRENLAQWIHGSDAAGSTAATALIDELLIALGLQEFPDGDAIPVGDRTANGSGEFPIHHLLDK